MMIAVWVIIFIPKMFFDTKSSIAVLLDSVIGFTVGGGIFLFIYIISRKGLGGGDVKFIAALGLYTGFSGTVSVMFYGTVIASLTGIILLILKKIELKDTIPLVPFLYIGILITIFFS